MSDKPRLTNEEIKEFLDSLTTAELRVVHLLYVLLKVYPKSNRGEHGRFRKPLPMGEYMIELLSTFRGSNGYDGEAELAAIDEFIARIKETDAEQAAQP